MPDITVTVANNCVSCNPNRLDLTQAGSPATITFTLRSPNYTYPGVASTAINITDTDRSFPSIDRTSDTVITVTDNNNDGQTHNYTVSVLDSNGNTISSDPMIVNRGGQ